jgi:hypothetical protein
MKTSRLTHSQIMAVLKAAEAGTPAVKDIDQLTTEQVAKLLKAKCRQLGVRCSPARN